MIFFNEGEQSQELTLEAALSDPQELVESFMFDELSRLPDEKRKQFVNSNEAQVMVERGLIGRRTLVKLSKSDDIERRIGMAAIQMAKEANDPTYDQLMKNRIKERSLLDKINTKYASKAIRVAKLAQRDYLKNRLPKAYSRA